MLSLEELKKYKQIFLFGTGKHGEVIYKKFAAEHLAVKAFCSSYGDKKTFMDLPVLRPDELPKDDDSFVVIASSCLQEISKILDEEGITNYIDGVGYAVDSVIWGGGGWTDHFLPENISRLKQARQRLAALLDPVSLRIYDSLIEYKCTQKAACIVTSPYEMYLHPDFKLTKHMTVLDCGAYTGDTLQFFREHLDSPHLIAVEPSQNNFAALSANALPEDELLHMAVGDRICDLFLKTDIEMEMGYFISSTGEPIHQTTIDTLFKDRRVDFIKMDIEGAELAALKGATATLLRDRPQLAICLYHRPDDLCTIPLFLADLLDNYTFHIGQHSGSIQETVLYGIPGEKS